MLMPDIPFLRVNLAMFVSCGLISLEEALFLEEKLQGKMIPGNLEECLKDINSLRKQFLTGQFIEKD